MITPRLNKTTSTVNNEGTIHWRKDDRLHRLDGPAVIYTDGSKEWWVDGKLHRDDGPALAWESGERWYQHGNLHRLDGPAVTNFGGDQWWFVNGKRCFGCRTFQVLAKISNEELSLLILKYKEIE